MLFRDLFRTHGDFFKSFAVILFFAVCLYLFSIGNYYNSDEGTILNGAWRMYNGDKLYTDFFSFIAPGSYWWTELSFNLFGPTYFSARIFSAFLLAVSVIAVYWVAILAGGSRFAAFFASFIWFLGNVFFVVIINHNNHSSYLASVAVLLVALALLKNGSVYFFASGLFIGITAVFLQTKGLALAAGLVLPVFALVVIGKVRFKDLLILCAGFIAVAAIMFYLWSPFFLYDTLIRWPQEHYLEVNKVSKIGWTVLWSAFAAVSYVVFRFRERVNGKIVFLLATSQFFLLFSALPRSDASHLFLISFGLISLAALALDKYLPGFSRFFNVNYRIFVNLTLTTLFIAVFVSSLASGVGALERERYFKNTIIRNRRFDNLYAHPFMPGLYFELGLPSPYRYDFLLTGEYPEEAFLDNLSKLKSENPEYVFVDYAVVGKFNYDVANVLDSYISENYEATSVFDTFQILKRK